MGQAAVREHFVGTNPVLARDRVLPVDPALAGLFPEHGLRRGSVIGISGRGGVGSLVFALLARPLAKGSWGAVVGIPELGMEAAAETGVRLDRLVLIPRPSTSWPDVVATLLDAIDLVVLRPPARCSPSLAHKLVARARERGCVLVVAQPASVVTGRAGWCSWPGPLEVALEVEPMRWQGLGYGFGTLSMREVAIRTSGRRVSTGPLQMRLYLPDTSDMPLQLGVSARFAIAHAHNIASVG